MDRESAKIGLGHSLPKFYWANGVLLALAAPGGGLLSHRNLAHCATCVAD